MVHNSKLLLRLHVSNLESTKYLEFYDYSFSTDFMCIVKLLDKKLHLIKQNYVNYQYEKIDKSTCIKKNIKKSILSM